MVFSFSVLPCPALPCLAQRRVLYSTVRCLFNPVPRDTAKKTRDQRERERVTCLFSSSSSSSSFLFGNSTWATTAQIVVVEDVPVCKLGWSSINNSCEKKLEKKSNDMSSTSSHVTSNNRNKHTKESRQVP